MANLYLCDLDLNKNELQNAVVQNLGTAPGTPKEGQIYYNTGDDTIYFRNASAWVSIGGDITGVTFIADGGSDLVTASGAVSLDIAGGTGVTTAATSGTITVNVDAAQTGITSLLAEDIKIGEDDQTKIDFETADQIHFYAANAEQVYIADGIFGPQTDNDVDLGTTGVRWKNAFFDGTVTSDAFAGPLTGNVTGNATTATALANSRNLQVALATTTAQAFSGNGNATSIGVSGVLASANLDADTAHLDVAQTFTKAKTFGTTNKLLFRDSAIYLNSSTDGQLDIVADTEIQIAATTIDINGAVVASGDIQATSLDINGNADISGDLTGLDNVTSTNYVIGGNTVNDIDIGTEFTDADDHIMSSGAIVAKFGLIAGSSSIVTTGVLNSGSINTSFGNINNGASTITTTGLISGGSLDIDDVLINGSNIGHTDDTDLIALADGLVTVNGSLTVLGTTKTNNVETVSTSSGVIFEGTAADGNDATLKSVVADSDKTYTLPNTTGFIGIFTTDPGTTNVTATTAELNALDLGSTAVGNAIASKAVVLDSNKDYTGVRHFTLSGELDAGSLDISGNADIAGNLTGLDNITSTNYIIGTHTVSDIDIIAQFVNADDHIMSSKAIGARFALKDADTAGNAATATNLVASTSSVVALGSINMGHASDTTIARSAAGRVTIEGQQIATSKKFALAHATTGVVGDTGSNNGNKVFTITHGMGSQLEYMVQVIAASGGATVFPCVTRTTTTVVVTFNAVVTASAYTALLVKI